jgi:hypothetical protein
MFCSNVLIHSRATELRTVFYELMSSDRLGESPLNRNDPKSEQYSLDLLKRVIPNFQNFWGHRSELGFVPVKGTLP